MEIIYALNVLRKANESQGAIIICHIEKQNVYCIGFGD